MRAMTRHEFEISLDFRHRVVFGRDFFAPGRPELSELLREGGGRRVLVFLEQAVAEAHPRIEQGTPLIERAFNVLQTV